MQRSAQGFEKKGDRAYGMGDMPGAVEFLTDSPPTPSVTIERVRKWLKIRQICVARGAEESVTV